MDHPAVCVQVNQIDREEHTDGVDALRRSYPYPFIRLQAKLSEKALQARQVGIGNADT